MVGKKMATVKSYNKKKKELLTRYIALKLLGVVRPPSGRRSCKVYHDTEYDCYFYTFINGLVEAYLFNCDGQPVQIIIIGEKTIYGKDDDVIT